jgi:hypothetical protein
MDYPASICGQENSRPEPGFAAKKHFKQPLNYSLKINAWKAKEQKTFEFK